MTPFFSIIIPVYNVAPYLRECLDSVLAQTFADWEAICVDDGSTDGSGAILDEYAVKDKRFKVIHQANAGVSAARNAALDIMNGDWVCFIDSDDVWEKSALMTCLHSIQRHSDVDIVKFGLVKFNDGDRVRWPDQSDNESTVRTESFLPSSTTGGWFCQRFYSRSIAERVRFPDLVNGEDTVFLANCNCKANAIVVVGKTLYGYRQRRLSASRAPSSLRLAKQTIKYTYQVSYAYDQSGKRIAASFMRWICNEATEGVATYIEQLAEPVSREMYRDAFTMWRKLIRLRIVPVIQKIRLFVVLALPHRLTAMCLFVIPRKLKRKGFHRWWTAD